MMNTHSNGCPFLLLAPMEGVGDRCFRKAMACIGGFDEAVTEFMRVPLNAHVASLSRAYDSRELNPIPLAPQIMGSDPELMAAMARELEKRGAHRIDLNCGCPSNTVTGKGAGSSLLKDPDALNQVAAAMVKAVKVPVTVKMRSGYEDISLFKENLLAAQASGIHFLTLHPRTKVDGYGPPAKWELIAQAKELLQIPVVGNGDILNVNDALSMLRMTKCDALMIGRGSVINPFIFHEIKAHFAGEPFLRKWIQMERFFGAFLKEMRVESSERMKINKLKQIMSFLFKNGPILLEKRPHMLTFVPKDHQAFLQFALHELKADFVSPGSWLK